VLGRLRPLYASCVGTEHASRLCFPHDFLHDVGHHLRVQLLSRRYSAVPWSAHFVPFAGNYNGEKPYDNDNSGTNDACDAENMVPKSAVGGAAVGVVVSSAVADSISDGKEQAEWRFRLCYIVLSNQHCFSWLDNTIAAAVVCPIVLLGVFILLFIFRARVTKATTSLLTRMSDRALLITSAVSSLLLFVLLLVAIASPAWTLLSYEGLDGSYQACRHS
jgi:hypothetical protein